jgi:G3E family GTPase
MPPSLSDNAPCLDKEPDCALEVCLVTGFLGSGKTTVLKELARSRPGRRLMFLVNELAGRDVDGRRVGDSSAFPVTSIVGGSLFCECVAGEFVEAIHREVMPRKARGEIDGLVIETSGMADPGAIGTLIGGSRLAKDLRVGRVVAVVPTPRAVQLLQGLPVAVEQVRLADTVILSKGDLATESAKRGAVEIVMKTNPGCQILWSDHGRLDGDVLGGGRNELPCAPLSSCDANPFTAHILPCPTPISSERFAGWLAALPGGVLRIKGELVLPEGRSEIDWTPENGAECRHPVDGTCATQRTGSPAEAFLVVIVHDSDAAVLSQIEKSFSRLLEHPQ